MKKLICLLVFISTVFIANLYSQTTPDSSTVKISKQLFFSVSGGYSVPVLGFKQYEQNNNANIKVANEPGAPKLGSGAKAELMFLFLKNLGITCTYYATRNMADTLGQGRFFAAPQNTSTSSNQYTYNYQTSSWNTQSIMLGMVAQFNVARFLRIRFRLSEGYQQVNIPSLSAVAIGYTFQQQPVHSSMSYTTSYTQTDKTTSNFAYAFGFDIRAVVKEGLGIMASVDYMNSVARFAGNYVEYSANSNHGSTPQKITIANTFNKSITMLLFNIGLTFEINFRKKQTSVESPTVN